MAKPKAAAEEAVRSIARGNAEAAGLAIREVQAFRFASEQLRRLKNEHNIQVSLEDASVEYAEAKALLGGKRLADAIQTYLASCANLRRLNR